MASTTITSATAVYLISIAGVFPTPVALTGFSVDEAFDTEATDAAVTQVGVDGTGVAGWVPREVPQTITLLASSPSNEIFDQWVRAQDAISDILYANGIIRIPSLGVQLTLGLGTLTRYPAASNAKRVMMPRVYMIHWLPQPGVPAISTTPI